jgi:hypothetical protein
MKNTNEAAMVAFGGLEILVFIIIPMILMLWALVDISKRRESDTARKFLWALVVIFIPLIGPLLYLTLGKKSLASHA